MGPNAAAIDATIRALEDDGRLTEAHASFVETARQLARAVDAAPDNASLWREYRAAQASLMEAESSGDDDDVQTFLLALRTPVGDGKDARPKDTRTRSGGGGGAARAAPNAVAKDGRRRRA
jgi:hypothetical protein